MQRVVKRISQFFLLFASCSRFRATFLLAHFLCARQSAANFYSILHSVCATLGFSGTPSSLLAARHFTSHSLSLRRIASCIFSALLLAICFALPPTEKEPMKLYEK